MRFKNLYASSSIALAFMLIAFGFATVFVTDSDAGSSTVAKIGTTEFDTLEEAVNAAVDGDTITIIRDSSGNGLRVAEGKFLTQGLVIDFANFKYTVIDGLVGSPGTESQAMHLLKDNKITLKNGTFESSIAKILIQNYSDLTLIGMKLILQNASYSNGYTLSNNNGDVIINNTEITANTGGGFAFDVCRYSSYPSVSVEVTGSSIIRGNIELYASGNDPKDGLSLKFTSGTLEGSIVMDESVIEILKTNPEKVTMLKGENAVINAPEGYHFDKDGNLKTGEAPEPEPEPDSSDDGNGVTVAIAISAVAVVVLIAAGLIIFRRQ